MNSVSRLFTIIFIFLFVESIALGLYFGTLTQAFMVGLNRPVFARDSIT